MRIVVISATSVIAKACLQNWAGSGNHEFVLVGRSQEKLEATSNDLELRFPESMFSSQVLDFSSPESISKLASEISQKPIDIVLVAQGSLTNQSLVEGNLAYLQAELELNAVSVAVVTEAFAEVLAQQGFGTLGVIGSVAGDRGRAYNYSYGASKALIETYTQGLQQRFGSSSVAVCLIKPGPTSSPMTVGHRGRMAEPRLVGKVIVAGLKAKRRTIFAPRKWAIIMFVVRAIPFAIFRKLKF